MTLPALALHLKGTGVSAQRDIAADTPLVFRAESIREERTGVHARLEISLGGVVLAWTACNVEKDEDRLRLANRASRLLPKEQRGDYLPDYLKHDLDYFCRQLWTTFLSSITPIASPGLPDWQPDYILNPYIIEGGGTILYAQPGAGKSYISLLMAQSINTGSSKLWPSQYRKTLFINLERSARSVLGRLGRINLALGLPAEDPLHILAGRGRSLLSLAPVIETYIREHTIEMIILDSLSRTGMGGLTLPEEVNPVINLLNRLIPTWLALAHTPRASDDRVYGGQMWDAGADILAQLQSQRGESNKLGICLTITKANDIDVPPPALWELTFPALGVPFGVRKATKWDYPDLVAKRKLSPREQIYDYLLEVGMANATQIGKAIRMERSNVSVYLKDTKLFLRHPKTGAHSEVPYSAVSSTAGV